MHWIILLCCYVFKKLYLNETVILYLHRNLINVANKILYFSPSMTSNDATKSYEIKIENCVDLFLLVFDFRVWCYIYRWANNCVRYFTKLFNTGLWKNDSVIFPGIKFKKKKTVIEIFRGDLDSVFFIKFIFSW